MRSKPRQAGVVCPPGSDTVDTPVQRQRFCAGCSLGPSTPVTGNVMQDTWRCRRSVLAGQQRLAAASVLVIGAGGLGSPAALYLAAAGVGTLGLVDHDNIELSNLQRQVLFTTGEVGAGKAETARARLLGIEPGHQRRRACRQAGRRQMSSHCSRDYDVVVDGTDRLSVRYLINDACVLLRKPLVSAAIHRFEGQAMTYVPDAGPCYRCLYPESSEGLVPNCAEAGVLGVLPGVMGSLQATEVIKILLGIGEPLVGRLLVYDALSLSFQEFRFQRRDDCAVCGTHPTITNVRFHEESPLPHGFRIHAHGTGGGT